MRMRSCGSILSARSAATAVTAQAIEMMKPCRAVFCRSNGLSEIEPVSFPAVCRNRRLA